MEKKVLIDATMREYLLDHGAQIADDGFITIPKRASRHMCFENSVRRPGCRTLKIPSVSGLALFYEGQHFEIR